MRMALSFAAETLPDVAYASWQSSHDATFLQLEIADVVQLVRAVHVLGVVAVVDHVLLRLSRRGGRGG